MKKQKLTLEELKVKSFVTEIGGDENALGGSTPLISLVTVTVLLCFPEEAGSGELQPAKPVEQNPVELQPAQPIKNDTLAPGPCNTRNICIA